jgi:hypothetical protein
MNTLSILNDTIANADLSSLQKTAIIQLVDIAEAIVDEEYVHLDDVRMDLLMALYRTYPALENS